MPMLDGAVKDLENRIEMKPAASPAQRRPQGVSQSDSPGDVAEHAPCSRNSQQHGHAAGNHGPGHDGIALRSR